MNKFSISSNAEIDDAFRADPRVKKGTYVGLASPPWCFILEDTEAPRSLRIEYLFRNELVFDTGLFFESSMKSLLSVGLRPSPVVTRR